MSQASLDRDAARTAASMAAAASPRASRSRHHTSPAMRRELAAATERTLRAELRTQSLLDSMNSVRACFGPYSIACRPVSPRVAPSCSRSYQRRLVVHPRLTRTFWGAGGGIAHLPRANAAKKSGARRNEHPGSVACQFSEVGVGDVVDHRTNCRGKQPHARNIKPKNANPPFAMRLAIETSGLAAQWVRLGKGFQAPG